MGHLRPPSASILTSYVFQRIFSAPVASLHARQICFPRTATRRVCTITSDPSTDTVTTLSVLILFSLSASAANSPPPSYACSASSESAPAAPPPPPPAKTRAGPSSRTGWRASPRRLTCRSRRSRPFRPRTRGACASRASRHREARRRRRRERRTEPSCGPPRAPSPARDGARAARLEPALGVGVFFSEKTARVFQDRRRTLSGHAVRTRVGCLSRVRSRAPLSPRGVVPVVETGVGGGGTCARTRAGPRAASPSAPAAAPPAASAGPATRSSAARARDAARKPRGRRAPPAPPRETRAVQKIECETGDDQSGKSVFRRGSPARSWAFPFSRFFSASPASTSPRAKPRARRLPRPARLALRLVSGRVCFEHVSLAREIARATSSVVGGGGAARAADAGSTAAGSAAAGSGALPPLATKKSVNSCDARDVPPALLFLFYRPCVLYRPCDRVSSRVRVSPPPHSTMPSPRPRSRSLRTRAPRRPSRRSRRSARRRSPPLARRAPRRASAFLASSSANARSARYTCSGGNWFVSSLCTARFTLRFASEASFSSAGMVRAVFRSSALSRSTLHRTHRPTSQVSPLPGDRSCNGAMRVVARGLTTTALTARSTSPETPTGSHGGSAGNASADPTETPGRFRDTVPPAGGTSHAGHCAIASCGPRRRARV